MGKNSKRRAGRGNNGDLSNPEKYCYFCNSIVLKKDFSPEGEFHIIDDRLVGKCKKCFKNGERMGGKKGKLNFLYGYTPFCVDCENIRNTTSDEINCEKCISNSNIVDLKKVNQEFNCTYCNKTKQLQYFMFGILSKYENLVSRLKGERNCCRDCLNNRMGLELGETENLSEEEYTKKYKGKELLIPIDSVPDKFQCVKCNTLKNENDFFINSPYYSTCIDCIIKLKELNENELFCKLCNTKDSKENFEKVVENDYCKKCCEKGRMRRFICNKKYRNKGNVVCCECEKEKAYKEYEYDIPEIYWPYANEIIFSEECKGNMCCKECFKIATTFPI